MFTQCPECSHTQTLSVEELRNSRGMIPCAHCATLFDALQRLSETPHDEAPAETLSELPWTQPARPSASHWGVLLGLGFIALAGQILYFEGPAAVHDETLRPWLEKACRLIKCTLPDYHKPQDFAVMQSTLTASDGGTHYIFQAVVSNQGVFPQAPPSLKLTLTTLTGEPFAQRVFRPDAYLASSIPPIETGQPVEISLNIAPVNTTIGGYTFEVL